MEPNRSWAKFTHEKKNSKLGVDASNMLNVPPSNVSIATWSLPILLIVMDDKVIGSTF